MGDSPKDQTALVRAGYNALSHAYRADLADAGIQRQYAEWLSPVRDRACAGGDLRRYPQAVTERSDDRQTIGASSTSGISRVVLVW